MSTDQLRAQAMEAGAKYDLMRVWSYKVEDKFLSAAILKKAHYFSCLKQDLLQLVANAEDTGYLKRLCIFCGQPASIDVTGIGCLCDKCAYD